MFYYCYRFFAVASQSATELTLDALDATTSLFTCWTKYLVCLSISSSESITLKVRARFAQCACACASVSALCIVISGRNPDWCEYARWLSHSESN